LESDNSIPVSRHSCSMPDKLASCLPPEPPRNARISDEFVYSPSANCRLSTAMSSDYENSGLQYDSEVIVRTLCLLLMLTM